MERKESYHGVDSTAEARFIPSSRFNVIAGLETIYDRENLGAPERIDRATGGIVLQGGARDVNVSLTNIGTYVSSNLKVIDPW